MYDLKGLRPESLNIRYLAWMVDTDPTKWAHILKKKASIPENRASAILNGASPSNEERNAILEGFSVSLDDLIAARSFGLSDVEIARENIKYLMSRLPYGEGKKMAQALGVTQETITRWKKTGVTNNIRPSKILQYLGLDPNINLKDVPLFLSLNPVGKFAVKKWLMDRLNNISSDELAKLFPALKKLFGHHEGN